MKEHENIARATVSRDSIQVRVDAPTPLMTNKWTSAKGKNMSKSKGEKPKREDESLFLKHHHQLGRQRKPPEK